MTNELTNLIQENKNLIYKLTHYFEKYEDKEDLFQVGIIGLIIAYRKYNASFGVKFTTYAYPFILGEMRKYVRENKGIKISKDITKMGLMIERASIILSQKLMREPSTKELADFLEVEEFEIAEAINAANSLQSIDEVIYSDSKELTLHDLIEDKKCDLDSLIELRTAINKLKPLDKNILDKRYYKDLTQMETARELGMTQVQISREEQKVLTMLKKNLAS